MTEIYKEIVAALKDHTSANPFRFRDLKIKLPDPLDAINSALDDLYENKIVNKCYMIKDDWQDDVYWPTAQALQPAFNGRIVTSTLHKLRSVPRRHELKEKNVPVPAKSIEVSLMAKMSKSSLIKSIIDKSPGIEHDELMLQFVGITEDSIQKRKAHDLILYVLKKGGYSKYSQTRVADGASIKCYYNDSAPEKPLQLSASEDESIKVAYMIEHVDQATNAMNKTMAFTKIKKQFALDLIKLLSALESWTFATKERMPDYLIEQLETAVDKLTDEVLV
jgi:hypothetical protein